MIPSATTFAILALAAYRLTRLVGWDDFPLAARLRAWAIGERWIAATLEAPAGTDDLIRAYALDPDTSLPGKTPPSEVADVRPAYDRPTLAHLVHCPFCIGWWISLATWVAWVAWHPVAYGLVPFAISGAVGLIAKNLDA